jgi:hypothetical protein
MDDRANKEMTAAERPSYGPGLPRRLPRHGPSGRYKIPSGVHSRRVEMAAADAQ